MEEVRCDKSRNSRGKIQNHIVIITEVHEAPHSFYRHSRKTLLSSGSSTTIVEKSKTCTSLVDLYADPPQSTHCSAQ